MTSKVLNPNHQVMQALDGQWQKIVALMMWKYGFNHMTFIDAEIVSFPQDLAVAIKGNKDSLEVFLLKKDEAEKLARKEGGLPV